MTRLSHVHHLQKPLSPELSNDLHVRVQEVVRLCLVLRHGPPVNISLPRTPYQTALAIQLKRALVDSMGLGLWATCPDLLLWSLVIAACVSYREDEWTWAIQRTSSVCGILQINDREVLGAHLRKFGFVPGHYAGLLDTLWNSVSAERQLDLTEEHSQRDLL